MDYNIKLEFFEGPLDLLLHLIKKNEVDIYDIPIATITEQYLEYIEILKDMNLDRAGDFLVMAATLTHIKSKMLLPIESVEEEEEEGPDPREELIKRLLEYQMYKEAAEELDGRERLGRDLFVRGQEIEIDGLEEPGLVNVSIFDLMDALKGVLARSSKETIIELTAERFKVADKINHILDTIGAHHSVTFTSLFEATATRGEVIVTFLAILELAKMLLIKLHQTEDNVIRVYTGPVVAHDKDKLASSIDEQNI